MASGAKQTKTTQKRSDTVKRNDSNRGKTNGRKTMGKSTGSDKSSVKKETKSSKSQSGTKRNEKRTANGNQTKNRESGKKTGAEKRQADPAKDENQKLLRDEVRFLLALGAAILVTMCNFHLCLDVGEMVYFVLHGLFGCLAYILPFAVLGMYLFMLSNRGSAEAKFKVHLCMGLFLLCCCLVHVVGIKESQPFSLIYYFTAGQSGVNGGLAGGLISGFLQHMVGTVATILIIVLLMLVDVILLTERSVVRTVQKNAVSFQTQFRSKTSGIRAFFREMIPEDERYDDYEEDDERDSYDDQYDRSRNRYDQNGDPYDYTRSEHGSYDMDEDKISPAMDFESNEDERLKKAAGAEEKVKPTANSSVWNWKSSSRRANYADFLMQKMPFKSDGAVEKTRKAEQVFHQQEQKKQWKQTGEATVSGGRMRQVKAGSVHAASAEGRPGSGSVRVLLERETRSLAEMGFEDLLRIESPDITGSIDDFIIFNGLMQCAAKEYERNSAYEEAADFNEPAGHDSFADSEEDICQGDLAYGESTAYSEADADGEGTAYSETDADGEGTAYSETDADGEGTAYDEADADDEGTAYDEADMDGEGAAYSEADMYNKEAVSGKVSGEGIAYTGSDRSGKDGIYNKGSIGSGKSVYEQKPISESALDVTEHVVLPEDGPVTRTMSTMSTMTDHGMVTASNNSVSGKTQNGVKNGGGNRTSDGIWKQNSGDGNRGSSGAVTFGGKPKPQEKKPVVKRPYVYPPANLLKRNTAFSGGLNRMHREIQQKLYDTLQSFGVRVNMGNISVGPSVTRYELEPEPGVKVSRIVALQDDIKLALAASDIRIEAPIPGKSAIGIEVPNHENTVVGFRELIESEKFRNHSSKVAVAVGRDISGQIIVADLAKMPHLLIAGATGSGKSVCINTLIMSIIYKASPEQVKLVMVDPKVVELSVYNGIPHLLVPVVTDARKAANALRWAVDEMNDRYKKFAEYNVRNLEGYNENLKKLKAKDPGNEEPYLYQMVIIVDELADLMMVAQSEVEEAICRLAQMARAAGIHLVLATQRPSVNVITGLIKANVPSRIAFAVSSGVDSRTIIDMNGAEKLLGKGDMLFYPYGLPKPIRVQGAFISDEEVSRVVTFLHKNNGEVSGQEMMEKMITSATESAQMKTERDEYFERAARFIIEKDKASIGALQRNFKIGFNRAARLMDQLAAAGVVGEEDGTKPRKILMNIEEFNQYMES